MIRGEAPKENFLPLPSGQKNWIPRNWGKEGLGSGTPPQEGGWVVWDTPSQPPTVAQMPFPKVSVQGATGTTMTRAFLNDPLGGVQPPVAKKVAGWKEGAD